MPPRSRPKRNHKAAAVQELETAPPPSKRRPARKSSKESATMERRKGRGLKRTQETESVTPENGTSDDVIDSSLPPPKRKKGGATEETDTAVFVSSPKPKTQSGTKTSKKPKSQSNVLTTIPENSHTVTLPISHPSHLHTPGEVMVLGQGDVGQLGLGEDVMERKKPFPVGDALEGKNVVQVSCGGMHTVALTDNGKVYTWGCNDEGVLGRLTEEGEEYAPGLVEKLGQVNIVQVSAGDSHTAALAANGNVYCWGVFRDSNGPFGLVTRVPSSSPELVYSAPSNTAVKVVSGSDHVTILTEQGDIFTFGCGEQGQLGRVPECFSSRGGRKGISLLLQPQVVRFKKARGVPKPIFGDVFCGLHSTFAVTGDQRVYVWGLNNYGQLGTNDLDIRFQPERLPQNWTEANDNGERSPGSRLQIAGGQHHTVLCQDGSVFVMGRADYGRLGLGENCGERSVPTRVPDMASASSVAAGSCCSFSVTESGEAYSWGMGTNHQLGTGEEEDCWSPTKITGKKMENRRVLAVSAGGQHAALLISRQDPAE